MAASLCLRISLTAFGVTTKYFVFRQEVRIKLLEFERPSKLSRNSQHHFLFQLNSKKAFSILKCTKHHMRRGVLLTFGRLLKNPSQITNSGVFATCLLKACHYNVSFIHTNIKLIITCNNKKYKSFDFLRFETSGLGFQCKIRQRTYHLTKYEEIIGFPGSRAGVRSFLPFGFSADVAHSIAKKIPCEQQALPRLPLSTNAPGQPDICPQGSKRTTEEGCGDSTCLATNSFFLMGTPPAKYPAKH